MGKLVSSSRFREPGVFPVSLWTFGGHISDIVRATTLRTHCVTTTSHADIYIYMLVPPKRRLKGTDNPPRGSGHFLAYVSRQLSSRTSDIFLSCWLLEAHCVKNRVFALDSEKLGFLHIYIYILPRAYTRGAHTSYVACIIIVYLFIS